VEKVAEHAKKDQVSKDKKEQRQQAIATGSLDFDVEVLSTENRTNATLDLQLDWHRQLKEYDLGTKIPMKKDVTRKPEKLKALIEAVKRYSAAGLAPPGPSIVSEEMESFIEDEFPSDTIDSDNEDLTRMDLE